MALARALVTEPRVLLLDEPLSNLDALLRDEMRVELKRLQQRLGTTMIFVTHDQAEALILSDRVVVMEAGRVEQVGRPEEVYRRPATAFVARFLGRANFLAGIVARARRGRHRGRARRRDCRWWPAARDGPGRRAARAGRDPPGEHPSRAGRRPDAARVNRFPAPWSFHAFAGQAHHYVVQLADGRELEVAAPGADAPLSRGTAALVEWAPEDVILLPGGPPAASPSAAPADGRRAVLGGSRWGLARAGAGAAGASRSRFRSA